MGTREELDAAGQKILSYIKTELCVSMRFFAPALDRLPYRMDLTTRAVGTDAAFIRFNPRYLVTEFIERPQLLKRTYVHMVLHCLFRHMYAAKRFPDRELWDLASDIAAEACLDGLKFPAVMRVPSDFRDEVLGGLKEKLHVLTAEKIYRHFEEDPPDRDMLEKLTREFRRCDHSFWDRMEDGKGPEPPEKPEIAVPRLPRESDWEKEAKRAAQDMAAGSEAGHGGEQLLRLLRWTTEKRGLYTEFLRRFAVVREEVRVDPDSFDYGFYDYGLRMYGNMPLIEENEYREAKRIEELVIAIDTSASCDAELVRKFLSETAGILASQESFFRKVRVHIIECDERVRGDTLLTDIADMKKYADGFAVRGGGGTDFRPVFRYVEELERNGDIRDLRGLLYFTDGYGAFPARPPHYDTAFVFREDSDHTDRDVPDWAMKLFLGPA